MQIPPEWHRQLHDISRVVLAYLLSLPIGWQREEEAHAVGVRTFPIVAMASCGYVLLAMPGQQSLDAQSRIIQGLVAGMGFIGAGAIMKAGPRVHGTAAAASIWNMGVLGAAIAQDRFLLAVVLAIVNFAGLRYLLPLKKKIDDRESRHGRKQ
ncbi:MAG TPA: MgtC/SapB family protein [Bryobacteraceae bacterium]|nr:MgtC/SapB family protein [Bryobacteraceae bacterium]